MLRKGDFKYNFYLRSQHELYDLKNDSDELINLIDDSQYANTAKTMKESIIKFIDPDNFEDRIKKHPRYSRHKHEYEFSNQYVIGDGTIVDARP